jgi:ethanolamine ammonia-lyase small subunit
MPRMNNEELAKIIKQVTSEVMAEKMGGTQVQTAPRTTQIVSDGSVPDLSAIDFKKINDTPNPANPDEFLRIKAKTSARLGVWRAGPRLRTNTYLRFRADHAAAMDAVFVDVPQDLIESLGLFSVQTQCDSKDSFLTRPDLGCKLSDEAIATLKQKCKMNPQVQLYLSDGLSSSAIVANAKDILPAIMQGLKMQNIDAGTPFFLKYGRVGAMDAVTETLGATVTVVLLGERPGLASGESMSAYLGYKCYVGMPEAKRTVVSNIHRSGTNPAEAGATIAELCGRMLREKVSGLDLKI